MLADKDTSLDNLIFRLTFFQPEIILAKVKSSDSTAWVAPSNPRCKSFVPRSYHVSGALFQHPSAFSRIPLIHLPQPRALYASYFLLFPFYNTSTAPRPFRYGCTAQRHQRTRIFPASEFRGNINSELLDSPEAERLYIEGLCAYAWRETNLR